MAELREPLVRGETMAARPGNDADGRRTMPSRAGVLLRALTLAAFAAGVWCLIGTANAFAGEHVAIRHTASGTPVRVDAIPGPRPAVRDVTFVRRVAAPLNAVELPSGDVAEPPFMWWAGGVVSPSAAALVPRTVGALLREARGPERLLPVVPGMPSLLPGSGRASRGAPRTWILPPGGGPAPQWSIVDRVAAVPLRTAPRPDPVTTSDTPRCTAAPQFPPPAHPAGLAADSRDAGIATLNPVRDSGSGIDKSPGLCALAQETPAPVAPPRSSWVASRVVPALCLYGSEPPVSPD
jgi:hypothetical protein